MRITLTYYCGVSRQYLPVIVADSVYDGVRFIETRNVERKQERK